MPKRDVAVEAVCSELVSDFPDIREKYRVFLANARLLWENFQRFFMVIS